MIPVGANLGIIGAEGEDISDMTGDGNGAEAKAEPTPAADETAGGRQKEKPAQTNGAAAPAASGALDSEFPSGVKATPVARRMAEENGVIYRAWAAVAPADGFARRMWKRLWPVHRLRKRRTKETAVSTPSHNPRPHRHPKAPAKNRSPGCARRLPAA
jgi:pyruvate/2-oxoglutarate dehydrogenase complex dihydrolipoamide acyltransferase (E2) component